MSRKLRIAYRGNFLPNVQPPESRWTTECQIAWTLEAMGHEVLRLQEDAVNWEVTLDVALTRDLFLWTQTWNVDPAGADVALSALRKAGVPSVSYHLDLYWGLSRAHQIAEYPFWRTDWVFTADGGHASEFEKLGVRHHWLPPAIYGPSAVIGQPVEEYQRFPVIFVGSYPYPHREHSTARQRLIAGLSTRFAPRFRVYNGGIRGSALADLYASASIIVGDAALAGRSPRYWSDRVPETLGRGGFLVHPHIEGMDEWYIDGEHLRYFEPGDMRQLIALIDYYLDRPEDREKIAANGRALVLDRDLYAHRLATVLDLVMAP